MKNWYLYIIETQQGKLYTGITVDVPRRFKQHINGTGAKFFRIDKPKTIQYVLMMDDRSSALKREAAIKKLNVKQKRALIEQRAESEYYALTVE
jgi:putative endonuclease